MVKVVQNQSLSESSYFGYCFTTSLCSGGLILMHRTISACKIWVTSSLTLSVVNVAQSHPQSFRDTVFAHVWEWCLLISTIYTRHRPSQSSIGLETFFSRVRSNAVVLVFVPVLAFGRSGPLLCGMMLWINIATQAGIRPRYVVMESIRLIQDRFPRSEDNFVLYTYVPACCVNRFSRF